MKNRGYPLKDSISRLVGALRYRGSPDLIAVLMVVAPSLFFGALLLAPFIYLFYGPLVAVIGGLYSFSDILTYPFINLQPLGFWVKVVDRGDYVKLVVSFKDLGVILNSFIAALLVSLLSTMIGVIVALLLARYDFPGKSIFRIASFVPLLYTPFVNAFVIYKLFGDGGIAGYISRSLFGVDIVVRDLAGVVLAQTMMFWPIVYMNAYASMIQIDSTLEEQAENLGARSLRLFRSITIPLSLPGIAAGAALVFIFSMEDLAAPLAFKVDNVISMWIVREILSVPDVSLLSMNTVVLALILLVTASTWFIAIKKYVSLRQYAMMQKGGRGARARRPGPIELALIYFVVAPWIVISAMPQIGVFVYAFTDRWTGLLPEGLTLDNFKYIIEDDRVVRAFRNSVVYALGASAITLIIAVSVAYTVSRFRYRILGALDVAATIPIALPGLALAMGILLLFGGGTLKDTVLDPLRNPGIYLVLAYAVRKSPFTTRAAFAGLQHVHVSLEEAAMSLGASRLRVIRDVAVPLIGINVLSGLLISFVYMLTEVSTSITIGSLNDDQAPITFIIYDYLTGGYGGGDFIHLAAAIVAILIIIQLLAITVVNLVLKQRYAFIGV